MVEKGIAAHGVPQRLLTDNGAALNPSRRGVLGQLVTYVRALGVEPITGKPYKPTTQGKNESFHQTLFRYLDKQPIADTLEQLQAQVDAFDIIYNTERPHQALPGRITPQAAWDATPKADPPRPNPYSGRSPLDGHPRQRPRSTRIVHPNGSVTISRIFSTSASPCAGRHPTSSEDLDPILIFDDRGTLITTTPGPPPGPKRRQRQATRITAKNPSVTDVLIQKCHRCPDTEPSPMS